MPARPMTMKPLRIKQSPLAVVADRQRGTTTERGYDAVWERVRADHLRREPLCRECRPTRSVPATQVDHIVTIRLRPDLRLVDSNLQSLCATHHSRKTRREQQEQARQR